MSKAKDTEYKEVKKETFIQGIVTLIFSQVLIKLLGLVYTLYLTNREGFGDEGNGIVAAGYQIYAMLLTISSIGVPNAISKLVSERIAIGDHKGGHRIFKIAFATFSIIGFIGSLMLFLGAGMIANNWLQIPEAEMTLVALSPAIFFVSISSVMRGYFNARQSIKTTARSQTIEQIFKTALTIIFVEMIVVLSGANTGWMAAGATLATTVATLSGFAYLYLYYQTKRKEVGKEVLSTVNYKYERVRCIIKKIALVSAPIALTAVMSSLNKNIDSFTVVRNLKEFMPEAEALAQYGILGGKVDMLIGLPLAFNVAFATALVPAIAAAKAKKQYKAITEKTSFSLLTSMLIGLPCTIGLCIFAAPILELLFPNASSGASVLQIGAFTVVFTILSQTINGALQGYGKLIIPPISLGIGMLVKLVCNLTLIPIPEIGVHGAIIGSVACQIVVFVISIIALLKNIKINLSFSKFVLKPIFATLVMAVCSYFIYTSILDLNIVSSNIATIIGLVTAVIIFGVSVLVLKIFTEEELQNLPFGNKINSVMRKLKIYNS